MLSLTSTGTELRRFRRGTLPKIAIGSLLLIPLLYGALYLWAFWDPTGHLDRLPVALVNSDSSVTSNGATVTAGSEVTSRLLASKNLDWVVADASTAARGVADGTYYFALTIPTDFSAKIASAGGADPTAAELMVTYNDANSFLASTLGREAMSQVQTAVSATVSQQAVTSVLVGLGSARDGFARASDGALTLRAASGNLTSGATSVATGASSVASGAADAATGATALATGTAEAATGATALASGTARLSDGATTAAVKSGDLTAGASQVATGVDQTTHEVGALATQLPALSAGLGQVGSYLAAHADAGDSTAATLLQGLQTTETTLPTNDQLTAMTAQLAALDAGAHAVADGSSTLTAGLRALADGTAKAATGARTLADGTATLATGARRLATGTGTLASGSADLATGATAVADGATKVTAGTQSLAAALAGGATAIPQDTASLQTQRAHVISTPVEMTSTDVATAQGFGEGFAPFFIPLALFVGALITWLLLRPVPPRALATPASGWRTTLAGFLPALAIGVGQVAIMLAVIHYGVGLHLANVVGTITFTLLIVAAFLALQQTLNAVFGPAAGKVVILALLMLQLASSGGTYPVETTPEFFRVVHPLLPMSYAVSGLREVITGGIDARLWTSVAYLGALVVVSLAVTAWRAGRMRTWSLERLHPVLEI
ncbi:MAG TPA: YhgE/Pip domain-containing protein [Cellulomonadaceae bacterium]|nr:YhgE/Pip domain-containing protein [Cellulomonadaceae bacterium]